MSELLFSDRLFTFNWIIKNFSFIRPDLSNPLRSPYFNVKAYSNACIELYPEGDLFSEKCLLLEIKIPAELENLAINCELSGYDLHGKALEFSKIETSYCKVWKFKRVTDIKRVSETSAPSSEKISLEITPESHTRGFRMCPARFKWPPEKRDETKKTVSDDTLIVKCIFHQLKVPLGNKSALGSMNDIHDVENLSQDFSRLLQSSQCSDLLLCAENEIFHVHKAILWARAPKFSNDLGLQNWNVSSGPVKVALDPPVLRLLLQYLYSGKLKTDKAEYFAGLSRIADTYGLVDLKQKLYIFPTESFLTTRIKVDRKSFMWHVNLKSPAERFYNPTFRSGCIPGSEFQLILSVCKGSGGLRNVDVCVRRLFPDKENPVFLHLMISLIGGGGRLRLPDAKKHYFLTDEEWWDGCVIKGPSESFIQEADFCEHVYLQCDLAVSAGDSSVLERSLCSSNSDVCNMTDFFCYSQDLKQLYNIFLPKFTDCILRAGKVRYPVHRAILSARSMVFSRIFTECVSDNSSNVIEITDIESAILNIILVYVYTGIVEELDYVNAIKIYSAANKYEIVSLKNAVTFFLKSRIEVNNVFELLRLAANSSDDNLKTYLIDFICSNPQCILALDDWDYLITLNVTLASEILHKTNVVVSKLNE